MLKYLLLYQKKTNPKNKPLLTSICCLLSPPHSSPWINYLHLLFLFFFHHSPPSCLHPPTHLPGGSNSDWPRSNFRCHSQWAVFGLYCIWQTWHQWPPPPSRNTLCPWFLRKSLVFHLLFWLLLSVFGKYLFYPFLKWSPRLSLVLSASFSFCTLSDLFYPLSWFQLLFIRGCSQNKISSTDLHLGLQIYLCTYRLDSYSWSFLRFLQFSIFKMKLSPLLQTCYSSCVTYFIYLTNTQGIYYMPGTILSTSLLTHVICKTLWINTLVIFIIDEKMRHREIK